jgi:hypothetical protein
MLLKKVNKKLKFDDSFGQKILEALFPASYVLHNFTLGCPLFSNQIVQQRERYQ